MSALSSYLDGKGAQAWVAIDQMAGGHPLADLVAIALERAIDPREWERALRPGSPSAVMQQAALRDTTAHERRRGHDAHTLPGIDGAGPAPATGR